MMTEFKRTQRDYPLSFKIAVVEQVEKGEMTYKQAQQRYGIQGRSTVLVWLRKYGRLDWSPDFLTGEEETACDSDNYPAHTRAKNQGT